ncbi:MAG: glycoside hydrolase family 88 protein [Propionibacteriaceae bacterium]|jgi:unsaturated chondroitin disaccharide hydrolase|nr:glycoside hydrolase family 88 protein [Propionibacteriaceae bacterium]
MTPLERALTTIRATLGRPFPDDCTVAGRYPVRPAACGQPPGSNLGWTTGFRTGELWLAYEATGEPEFRAAAARDVTSFADRIERGIDTDTHDLGFLYTLSCVAADHLAGDPAARAAALRAAATLRGRIIEPAGIVQAWGYLDDPAQRGRTIVDSLMNMPLFRWAAAELGDGAYAAAADRHVAQLRDHILRPDDTTFHTFWWDPATGAPLRGTTQQGFSDDSCWARGQAWGVYGFTLDYAWTGQPASLTAARRCADYYLAHLPADHVPYWDLVFADGSGAPRDSSAAAIAACGLLELARWVTGADRDRYQVAAAAAVQSLADGYAADPATSDALLLHGVYDLPKGVGVDEANLWGDYFYLEALTRLATPEWTPYWLVGQAGPGGRAPWLRSEARGPVTGSDGPWGRAPWLRSEARATATGPDTVAKQEEEGDHL